MKLIDRFALALARGKAGNFLFAVFAVAFFALTLGIGPAWLSGPTALTTFALAGWAETRSQRLEQEEQS